MMLAVSNTKRKLDQRFATLNGGRTGSKESSFESVVPVFLARIEKLEQNLGIGSKSLAYIWYGFSSELICLWF